MANQQDNCLFCKIINGELPSTKVYENDRIVAFRDIAPSAKEHILIIPKKHIPTLNDIGEDDWSVVTEIIQSARKIADQLGIAESGYRLVNNCNKEGGQVVYHLHFHLLGGEQLGKINAS